jgi:hypothetical protein
MPQGLARTQLYADDDDDATDADGQLFAAVGPAGDGGRASRQIFSHSGSLSLFLSLSLSLSLFFSLL